MCGILGALATCHPIEVGALQCGLDVMAHRGPDGSGVWERAAADAPFVALGHCRLAIIDLSDAGAQPMACNDGQSFITFNGEIYNYRELMAELAGLGWRFESQSDTEVLLCAYRQWGPECVQRLNGMFAFAIWDEAKRELFAARDRFGEKPFHYVRDDRRGVLAFASEMKGLFAAGMAQVELNDAALQRYSETGILDGDRETIYRGIRRLPPAGALLVSVRDGNMDVREWTYWTGLDGVRWDGRGDVVEQFRELFEDSIRLRLRADVPVGTSLSGGLDSAAVICTTQRIGAAGGQRAFSARMSDPRLDEGPYIHTILKQTGIQGHEIVPTHEELERLFLRMCFHQEEPFPATSMFAQFLVMRLAQQHGVTVLLDGQGADELLGGYHGYFRLRYGDLIRSGRWVAAQRELSAYAALRSGQRAMSARGVGSAFLPARLDRRARILTNGNGFSQWWSGEWRAALRDDALPNGVEPYLGRFPARLRHDSLRGPLQELLRFGDRNSMAWSRELRQPFLDHRLAEFAYSLPPIWKISEGMTKVVLRRAMDGIIPDEISRRTDKLGYQAPLGQWLSQEMRPWVEDRLQAAEEALDGRTVRGLADRFRRLNGTINEWQEGRDLFRLMTLGAGVAQMKDVARDGGPSNVDGRAVEVG